MSFFVLSRKIFQFYSVYLHFSPLKYFFNELIHCHLSGLRKDQSHNADLIQEAPKNKPFIKKIFKKAAMEAKLNLKKKKKLNKEFMRRPRKQALAWILALQMLLAQSLLNKSTCARMTYLECAKLLKMCYKNTCKITSKK